MHDDQVPSESTAMLRWSRPDPTLTMADAQGGVRVYDFTSIAKEGDVAALSIRVGPGLVVQTDCLIGNAAEPTAADFMSGRVLGVRFQPFFLPGAEFDSSSLRGRGLFKRGLHYSGIVTPANVSLLCICDSCEGSFRLQSFHAGFSSLSYFYCSSGLHTLTVSSQGSGAPPSPHDAAPDAWRTFEETLPECTRCGGDFAYGHSLRCPICGEPYIDFAKYPEERRLEYYGNYFYGDQPLHLGGQGSAGDNNGA